MENLTLTENAFCLDGNLTNASLSNCTMATSQNGDLFMKQFGTILYRMVLPVICIVGLFGNVISIYLITVDKQMRNISSSIYLVSVLGADTGFLLSLFLVWMEALGYPLNHLPVMCRVNVYLTYVSSFLSIWYVVCITVETFITICHPTKIKQMCTSFRARVVALVLLLTALFLYAVSPLITAVQPTFYPHKNITREHCGIISKYGNLATAVAYTDTVLTLILPFILLIILLTFITLAIITSIQKKKKRSVKKTAENGATQGSNAQLPQVRVAKMLFILSVSVVLLNAPSHVFRIWSLIMQVTHQSTVIGFIQLVFLFVSYSSFSLKFFICLACSENFRKLFINHCCCCRAKRYHSVPQQTMETAA